MQVISALRANTFCAIYDSYGHYIFSLLYKECHQNTHNYRGQNQQGHLAMWPNDPQLIIQLQT